MNWIPGGGFDEFRNVFSIDEAIERESKIASENQKKVDTHIAFIDDDGNNVFIEELYCDDTEVINECLDGYQYAADYHKQIAEWLTEFKKIKTEEIKYQAMKEGVDNFTEGLDESIYCAMCTNSMANDRGCDGNCKVDKAMYKKVMDNISVHLSLATHGEYSYKWHNREITSPFSDDID